MSAYVAHYQGERKQDRRTPRKFFRMEKYMRFPRSSIFRNTLAAWTRLALERAQEGTSGGISSSGLRAKYAENLSKTTSRPTMRIIAGYIMFAGCVLSTTRWFMLGSCHFSRKIFNLCAISKATKP